MSDLPQEETRPTVFSREWWAIFAPAIVVSFVGFLLAWSFVGPPPPKKLKFASGSSWGAYYKFANKYKERLANEGLEVEVLQTKGSTDNLRLLTAGEVDIAFVQGGVEPKSGREQLRALASVYLEPLWVFTRGPETQHGLLSLRGKRVAIGSEGSGTRAIALQLLKDNRLENEIEILPLSGEKAMNALLADEVDAIFMVGSHTIKAVQALLKDPRASLLDFERASAYRQRHQFLTKVTLYQGVVDLAENIPPQDVNLVAPAATLVVRDDFHPSLIPVFLQASLEIHGGGGILQKDGEFPTPLFTTFPVSTDARYFFKHGLSYLYRHLDFHVANAIDRLTILLLPLLGLLLPLARLLPPVYWWTMRRKIYRQYRAISELENRAPTMSQKTLMKELESLEERVDALKEMPASWGAEVHTLRIHFDRAKHRMENLGDTDS